MVRLTNQLELLQCPHCAIAKPMLTRLWHGQTRDHSGANERTWVIYACSTCGGAVTAASTQFGEPVKEVYPNNVQETFEMEYLTGNIREDFSEALSCYSARCLNAFAAMARRTVQSVCEDLGAEGKDKVLSQLNDLKQMSQIDDDTFAVLKQLVIAGHDGAHPYLPKLSTERAAVLLELMRDVLYQVYVRKGKLQKAMELRQQTMLEAKR